MVSRLESEHRGVADRCLTRQLRQLHSFLPPTSFFHSANGGGDVCGSASRVDQAMEDLRTDHCFVNDVEYPSGSNDSSGIVNDNLHDSGESDLRVSLADNGLVGPYSATVLVTLSSAPDHRPPRLASAR
ncbi:hypothetical protein TNCV_2814961 [Trichonephila clavipes]|nr:hypothetical protein TNCV_2814961 [Trichonephila clavipes]